MRRLRRPVTLSVATFVCVVVITACSSTGQSSSSTTTRATPASPVGVERVSGGPTGTYLVPAGVHKIKHVIMIQQENRSFDSYFGTFPVYGANDSNYITIILRRMPGSAFSGIPLNMKPADHDIYIGGNATWDYNKAANTPATTRPRR